ncbi:MAG: lamin tail domain-containing protein, partial [Candidatus Peribacteraceae bacterium]|nr:lamin tail domain-containing protein [Candidatus Peribacteraceae bacterium]
MRTLLFSVLLLSIIPLRAFASPVISEVMWMGTSLGSSDEWLEIMNPDALDADLSGWTVTSVNSSGKEVVSFRFETGSILRVGEYLVIASKSAASSRLLHEPFGVSSTLSLPNTKLLLRLRDSAGSVMDEIDDGVGAPFAGENPSGTEGKASMERMDPAVAGTVKENWRSAMQSLGFDPNAGDKGTPGFG